MTQVGTVLEQAHRELGWPEPASISRPSGTGARAVVRTVEDKLGRTLRQMPGGEGVQVGVLTAAPEDTTAPLAITCEFQRPAPPETRLQAHRIAWNLSQTNLLVTVEPQLLRAWTCCEPPLIDRDRRWVESDTQAASEQSLVVLETKIDADSGRWENDDAAAGLHWAELVSGHIFHSRPHQFRDRGRAHSTLLANLRDVRYRLRDLGLADRYTHDLLARIIFVQFLFDRKDSQGQAALDAAWLDQLYDRGIFVERNRSLAELLAHEADTYALFAVLNDRFNGDLFAGDGVSPAWAEERVHVHARHLRLLADFVDARGDFATGQLSFWRRYAFDAIPLDLISSIYEQFVSGSEGVGVHYTPPHVVDHILDRVLPWEGPEWDLRILDPACGSGIFLVKAYQRLAYRWRCKHDPEIPVAVLRKLLQENLFGADRDAEAVRVAAFSLYLAMCDEIEPKRLWEHPDTVFPPLRGHRLVEADFFKEDVAGLRTTADAHRYDLAVGNPPGGDQSLQSSEAASRWAAEHGWSVANKDLGALFVAKAIELTRPGGLVALVQSAASLLYNTERTARAVQRRMFLEHRQVEGVTLFPPWMPLFRGVRVAACVIVVRNSPPDGSEFLFESPKRQRTSEDRYAFVLEPYDVHWITPAEVIEEPWLWSTLAWGGERDRAFIRRLQALPTLETLHRNGEIATREGLNRGNQLRERPELVGWRHLDQPTFPGDSPVRLNGGLLPKNEDAFVDTSASTDLSAFALPQLLLKRSLLKKDRRFHARIVENEPVLCEKMYVSVHGSRTILERACLVYNSDLATYHLFLTSGRFAFDRNNPNIRDLRSVPLPLASAFEEPLRGIRTGEEAQARAFELFDLTDVERILVEDLVRYTFGDERAQQHLGRVPTRRRADDEVEPDLAAYGAAFRRVVHAGYGDDVGVRMEILGTQAETAVPVRAVRFVIGPEVADDIVVEALSLETLRQRLAQAYQTARETRAETPFLRCARVYGTESINGARHLAITHIKPDQMRFWTRAVALRDADDLALDLSAWADSTPATAGMQA